MPLQGLSEAIRDRVQVYVNGSGQLTERIRNLRRIQQARRFLINANILHRTTAISPLRMYLFAVIVGFGLLISSVAVGLAAFTVEIEIVTDSEKIRRTLDLGYLSQSNYGLWYLILCPVLLAILACAYDAMRKAHERYPAMLPSLEKLGKTSWIAFLGIAIFSIFVVKNIVVEWNDYRSLSLGWVQAKPLQDYRDEIDRTGIPIDLVARGKRFDRFLLPKQERFIQKNEIRAINLIKVDPELNVRSVWWMIVFIVATKFWAGFWEAIVIYFAMITFVWGLDSARKIDLASLKDSTGSFYHLSWIGRPAFYIFLVGLLVDIFCIFRYVSNAVKGSYGKWDQYWSFLVFSPAIFMIPFCSVMSAVFNSSDNERQIYASKKLLVVAGAWFITFAYVVYLVLGYINPRQQTILVACFKPFLDIFKKLFGF